MKRGHLAGKPVGKSEAEISNVLRHERILDTRPLLHDADHLTGITEFVVIPNVQHTTIVLGDRGTTIDDGRVPISDEVGRDHFG